MARTRLIRDSGAKAIRYDQSLSTLIFMTGRYELAHGTLGAIRSLGRLGVSVSVSSENRWAPYAFSRHLAHSFRRDTCEGRSPEMTVAALRATGERLGRRALLLPADDEAAIIAYGARDELSEHFLLPDLTGDLVRRLASKRGLGELCNEVGVATPETVFAEGAVQLMDRAESVLFPVVIKNSEPWTRFSAPGVPATTKVGSQQELAALAATWTGAPQVVIQEYIPDPVAEDWIVHAYCGRDGAIKLFTGRKFRSWPPQRGVTAMARALPNESLAEAAMMLLRRIGYRGIVDMDWRFDRRDHRHKLVDLNPRFGANFRLFVDENGVDVVRAAHLDLSGRRIPEGAQKFGRRFVVENLYLASRLYAYGSGTAEAWRDHDLELAWFSWDDPTPFIIMAAKFFVVGVSHLWRQVSRRLHLNLGASRALAPALLDESPRFRKSRRRGTIEPSMDD